jgi:hypothetical protein
MFTHLLPNGEGAVSEAVNGDPARPIAIAGSQAQSDMPG